MVAIERCIVFYLATLCKKAGVKVFFILSLLFLTEGCGFIIGNRMENWSSHLQQAIVDSTDPETVSAAIPAYLLLQQALLNEDPDNIDVLLATSKLYQAYAGLSEGQSIERKKRLNEEAFLLARRASCLQNSAFCGLLTLTFTEFAAAMERVDVADFDSLYVLGTSWTGWIQVNSDDWKAVAQLAQVKKIMSYLAAHDETYQQGQVLLYLAILESIMPPALGGNAELAQQYYEKAMRASSGKNLMVQIMYASRYARMVFDRELHDRLLNEVLAAEPRQHGLTLSNVLAQKKAVELLKTADSYF